MNHSGFQKTRFWFTVKSFSLLYTAFSSSSWSLNFGVLQGSVLGSFLFSSYTHCISNHSKYYSFQYHLSWAYIPLLNSWLIHQMANSTPPPGCLRICRSDLFFSLKPAPSTAILILINGNSVHTVFKDKYSDIIFHSLFLLFPASPLSEGLVGSNFIYIWLFLTTHTPITLVQYPIISCLDFFYSLYCYNNLF